MDIFCSRSRFKTFAILLLAGLGACGRDTVTTHSNTSSQEDQISVTQGLDLNDGSCDTYGADVETRKCNLRCSGEETITTYGFQRHLELLSVGSNCLIRKIQLTGIKDWGLESEISVMGSINEMGMTYQGYGEVASLQKKDHEIPSAVPVLYWNGRGFHIQPNKKLLLTTPAGWGHRYQVKIWTSNNMNYYNPIARFPQYDVGPAGIPCTGRPQYLAHTWQQPDRRVVEGFTSYVWPTESSVDSVTFNVCADASCNRVLYTESLPHLRYRQSIATHIATRKIYPGQYVRVWAQKTCPVGQVWNWAAWATMGYW